MLLQINQSFFYYKDNMGLIDIYYQMIVNNIKKILENNPEICVNITLCDNTYNFNNSNKIIKININYEHTLVKNGGRSVPENTPFGIVNDDYKNKYLVRIDRYDELNNSDIIIDYSIPNIYNVSSCNLFRSFSKKHFYISSSIYDLYFIKENRNINILTTFINTSEPRRATLLNKINSLKISHINISNCFEKNNLQELYKNTKIIINIHQTEHHHTFEELRVLPALECGVIVICENSPLYKLVPYYDYIIWTNYDNIIEKTLEIMNNYDYYYDLIFSKEKINKLSYFNDVNYNVLKKVIY